MALEPSGSEPVQEELPHQQVACGQGYEALPHISGRKSTIFVAQLARGAAVIGHSYNCRQAEVVIMLKACKQGECTGASPNHNYVFHFTVTLLARFLGLSGSKCL